MLEIRNPNNISVPTSLGVYTRENVTRNFAGTYTCVVRNTLDNSTVSETSTVVIQCKLDQNYIYGEISRALSFAINAIFCGSMSQHEACILNGLSSSYCIAGNFDRNLIFLQWKFGTQLSNLIPANISGYTV